METTCSLARNEVNNIAFDPIGGGAVQTLIESAAGFLRSDYSYWTESNKASELLIELENATAILRKRIDILCERELAN